MTIFNISKQRKPSTINTSNNTHSSNHQQNSLIELIDNSPRVNQLKNQSALINRLISPSKTVVQRKLFINDVEKKLEDLDISGSDPLKALVSSSKDWKFSNLKEATNVGTMLAQIKTATQGNDYKQQTPTDLGLNTNLVNILTHFRDPDHSDSELGYDSKGKSSDEINMSNPNVDQVLGAENDSNIRDSSPSEGRKNEALITAIKLKSMNFNQNVKLKGEQAVDYILEDSAKKQYGFDPFELPSGWDGSKEGLTDWVKDAYEKHVRTKQGNVGNEGKKASYAGLLDISGIDEDKLNTLINTITEYEKGKKGQENDKYIAPYLSLVNSHLKNDNVADYDFPSEFDKPEMEPLNIFD